MELKEIEKKFEQYINSFNKDIPKEHIDLISPKGIVLDFIQAYGKEQYNRALYKAQVCIEMHHPNKPLTLSAINSLKKH